MLIFTFRKLNCDFMKMEKSYTMQNVVDLNDYSMFKLKITNLQWPAPKHEKHFYIIMAVLQKG